jgi:hypothetical protein
MSLYIHHVPGRLRVRTQSFRCQPGKIEAAAGRLRESTQVAQAKVFCPTVSEDPQGTLKLARRR